MLEDLESEKLCIIQKKNHLSQTIKDTDKELTYKMARKKYLDAEIEKYNNIEHQIRKHNNKESHEFFSKVKSEDCKNNKFFILDKLSGSKSKLEEFEKILTNIYSKTKTENLAELIDLFNKNLVNYNQFTKSFGVISQQLYLLEKEVENLEFIISFNNDVTSCNKNYSNNKDSNLERENELENESKDFNKDSFTIINQLCNRCPFILDLLNLKNQSNQSNQNQNANENNSNDIKNQNKINKLTIVPIKNEDVSILL